MKTIFEVFLIVSLFLSQINTLVDEFEYLELRERLESLSKNVPYHIKTEKEAVVSQYMKILKQKELSVYNREYLLPIEKQYQTILKSNLYKLLVKLPKGGNLHLHEWNVLDRRFLLQLIQNSTKNEFDMLYICDDAVKCGKETYFLKYFLPNTIPPGWLHVRSSNWTVEKIARKSTLFDFLNDCEPISAINSSFRWSFTEYAFNAFEDLLKYNGTRYKIMKAMLDQTQEDNIQLLELRSYIFNSWYFNENGAKTVLDQVYEFGLMNEFRNAYLRDNPRFIDFSFIICTDRNIPIEDIEKDIDQVIMLNKLYPDLVRGYDLVNEEDRGHSLFELRKSLFKLVDHARKSNGTFRLYLHTGETNWPDDYVPFNETENLVSPLENIYDAILLNVSRIGHGLGLFKYPKLYPIIQSKQIAIELCPVSNQLLGYTPDIRNHPGMNYYRSGLPVVISSDDPGVFGYPGLTLDFYMVFLSWGLDLNDLKNLIMNSIQYSSIKPHLKSAAFNKWSLQWDKFINSTHKLACETNFKVKNLQITEVVPFKQHLKVYGDGFEALLCKRITCLYGNYSAVGVLNTANELTCKFSVSSNHSLQFSLKANNEVLKTKFYF